MKKLINAFEKAYGDIAIMVAIVLAANIAAIGFNAWAAMSIASIGLAVSPLTLVALVIHIVVAGLIIAHVVSSYES